MKKIALILIVFFIVSCSNNNNEPMPVLLKHIRVSGFVGVFNYDFEYYGNRLHKITCSDGTRQEYFYSDDVIAEIKDFNAVNVLTQNYVFQYNSDNKLGSYTTTSYESNVVSVYKQTFNYLSNGTILVNSSTGNVLDSNSKLIYFNGSEISKSEYLDTTGTVQGIEEYTSDNKNNPMKNVLGFDKIAFVSNFQFSNGLKHNTLSTVSHSLIDPSNDITFTFLADYNELGYPKAIYPDIVTSNYDVNYYQYVY
jgi:hypothetical protein